MHKSAMLRMEWFVNHYVPKNEAVKVLDVGSYDVNGSYRELFADTKVIYVGLDMEDGPNVDCAPKDPYQWNELEDESFDFVISGNAFEHIEYPWLTINEIGRKLKQGGYACILAPNSLYEHRYPLDCYRYFADGFRALAKWAKLDVIDVTVSGVPDENVSDEWYAGGQNDTMMILSKGVSAEIRETLPKFQCEIRYRHAVEWDWRYHFLLAWIHEDNMRERICQYLKEEEIRTVYLYGYGAVGRIVYKELNKVDGISLFVIDRNADAIKDISAIRTGDKIDETEEACILCSLLDLGMIEELRCLYPKIRTRYVSDIFRLRNAE